MRLRVLSAIAVLFSAGCSLAAPRPSTPELAVYIFPQNAVLTAGAVDPHRMTRLNYAFALIQNGVMVPGYSHDVENLAFLTALRKQNPGLTVLVSVGGWLGSSGFSDMALTRESRAKFIQSAMDFISKNNLDGLDIDWEYPGQPGSGHAFRAEDKENYTALLGELRAAFDRRSRASQRRLYLTVAAGASPDFLEHTEMRKVARLVDTVNLMSYDYYEPGSGPITGHHAPLYTNPKDPEKVSGDASVRAFEQAGVPASKLVLGIPFYGHVWAHVPATDDGLYQPGKPAAQTGAPYSAIASMLGSGFVRHWDSVSDVPWLYNPATRTFVSYEDPQSLALKCRYLHAHHLAGAMVWDLENDDPSGTMLKALDACLQ